MIQKMTMSAVADSIQHSSNTTECSCPVSAHNEWDPLEVAILYKSLILLFSTEPLAHITSQLPVAVLASTFVASLT